MQRIEHHRHGRERVDGDHHEGDVGLLALVVRQRRSRSRASRRRRRPRCRRRRAPHRRAFCPNARASRNPDATVSAIETTTSAAVASPSAAISPSAMRKPEQRHRPAQQHLQAEDDARAGTRAPRQRVEHDADQQRDHHGGDRNDHAANQRRGGHRRDGDQRRETRGRAGCLGSGLIAWSAVWETLGGGLIDCHEAGLAPLWARRRGGGYRPFTGRWRQEE